MLYAFIEAVSGHLTHLANVAINHGSSKHLKATPPPPVKHATLYNILYTFAYFAINNFVSIHTHTRHL